MLELLPIVGFVYVLVLLSTFSFFSDFEDKLFNEGRFEITVDVVIRLVVDSVSFLAIEVAYLASTGIDFKIGINICK